MQSKNKPQKIKVMIGWYLAALRKYAEFNGRARRSEFWYFALANFLIGIALNILDMIIGSYGAITGLYSLAVLIPSLAVGARRLHDTNKSGWWLLLLFIPIVGAIVLIVFFAQEGDPGDNQFGPNPKLRVPTD